MRLGRRGSLANVTSLFFDSAAVTSRVDVATRRALSKFGAYVRSDARRSIRKATTDRPSKPGKPPRSRIGTLKQHIYFSYEPASQNVVIGPALLARARNDNLVMLEHGGRRTMKMPARDPNSRRGTVMVRRVAKYPARPFMQPAFVKNQPKAASLYKDAVSR